jgi:hypothetical protein
MTDLIAQTTNTVADIPDDTLLGRAVKSARSSKYPKKMKHPRWVGVTECFSVGSTYANQLCRRFNLDPDEMVAR